MFYSYFFSDPRADTFGTRNRSTSDFISGSSMTFSMSFGVNGRAADEVDFGLALSCVATFRFGEGFGFGFGFFSGDVYVPTWDPGFFNLR
jgi:hypothetical protein